MVGANIPQWLVPSFSRSVAAAGGTADAADVHAVADRLLAEWSAPHRRFHNVRHLVAVLARVDELNQEAHDPALVRLAAWYHGVVFDPSKYKAYAQRGGEDEAASARVAREQLGSLGVPEATARRVGDLVQLLERHAAAPSDIDAQVLCDADMAMLACEPQKYRTYLSDVRSEYDDVPLADFLQARRRIVGKLLARKVLFQSPQAAAWEAAARQNLAAELQRIEHELAKMDLALPPLTAPVPAADDPAAPGEGATAVSFPVASGPQPR